MSARLWMSIGALIAVSIGAWIVYSSSRPAARAAPEAPHGEPPQVALSRASSAPSSLQLRPVLHSSLTSLAAARPSNGMLPQTSNDTAPPAQAGSESPIAAQVALAKLRIRDRLVHTGSDLSVAQVSPEEYLQAHPEMADEFRKRPQATSVTVVKGSRDLPLVQFQTLQYNCPVLQNEQVPLVLQVSGTGQVLDAGPVDQSFYSRGWRLPQEIYSCTFTSSEYSDGFTTLFPGSTSPDLKPAPAHS